jgi:hypothetical protein
LDTIPRPDYLSVCVFVNGSTGTKPPPDTIPLDTILRLVCVCVFVCLCVCVFVCLCVCVFVNGSTGYSTTSKYYTTTEYYIIEYYTIGYYTTAFVYLSVCVL